MTSFDPKISEDVYLTYNELESSRALNPDLIPESELIVLFRNYVINLMSENSDIQHTLPEVFFLAVTILDHYLEIIRPEDNIALSIPAACLLIAGKYEENELNIHILSQRLHVSPKMILGDEFEIFKELKYDLGYATIYTYLNYFTLKLGLPLIEYNTYRTEKLRWVTQWKSSSLFHSCCLYISEMLCLSQFRRELPSKLAAVAIYLARASQDIYPVWNEELASLTRYDEEQLQKPLMNLIILLRKEAANKTKRLISKKYNQEKYHGAATAVLTYVTGGP